LKRIRAYVERDPAFLLTYGDGLADIDLKKVLAFHQAEGRLATVTAVQPPGRFGALDLDHSRVRHFMEKPQGDGGWISGGFFGVSPRALDRIDGDQTVWEREPLEGLAREGQLSAFRHPGFFQPLDTLRDKRVLDQLWDSGQAPWKVWSSTE